MTTWLWWQTQLEIGPAINLDKSIENLLENDIMSDDQSMTCLEILRGV